MAQTIQNFKPKIAKHLKIHTKNCVKKWVTKTLMDKFKIGV